VGECCCHGLIFSLLVDPRLILSTDNNNTTRKRKEDIFNKIPRAQISARVTNPPSQKRKIKGEKADKTRPPAYTADVFFFPSFPFPFSPFLLKLVGGLRFVLEFAPMCGSEMVKTSAQLQLGERKEA